MLRKPHDADRIASDFDAIFWVDICHRHEALPDLSRCTLLHAGPPLRGTPPAPMLAAAIQAMRYEGLATDRQSALDLIQQGQVILLPAQDYGVTTPLAQVVSASMPLAVVRAGDIVRYAPLAETGVPALRFGRPAADTRARLRLMDIYARTVLKGAIGHCPVALAPLIEAALEQGEECHSLTAVINREIAHALDIADGDREILRASPGFALPVLMAACSARLACSTGDIVAVGGNGERFGYRERGAMHWQCDPATPPRGVRLPGHEHTVPLGAIGDSAVVDFAGLGAQALSFCPGLVSDLRDVLPEDIAEHRPAVVDPAAGVVTLAAIRRGGRPPLVNLAILDRDGEAGMIGRGVFRPNGELFGRC